MNIKSDRELEAAIDAIITNLLEGIPSLVMSTCMAFRNHTGNFDTLIKPGSRVEFLIGNMMGIISTSAAINMVQTPLRPGMDYMTCVALLSNRMFMRSKEIMVKIRRFCESQGIMQFMEGNTDSIDDKTFMKMINNVKWILETQRRKEAELRAQYQQNQNSQGGYVLDSHHHHHHHQ